MTTTEQVQTIVLSTLADQLARYLANGWDTTHLVQDIAVELAVARDGGERP